MWVFSVSQQYKQTKKNNVFMSGLPLDISLKIKENVQLTKPLNSVIGYYANILSVYALRRQG